MQIFFVDKNLFRSKHAIVLVLFLLAFKGSDNSELLFQHFTAALHNRENFQNYLVVRIHDLRSNEVREFCTLGCFFRNALHREWALDYDKLSDDLVVARACMNNPRLFDFKSRETLEYLNTDLYSENDLYLLKRQVDFKKLAREIIAGKSWEKDFGSDDKLLRLYAHALFNEGILTGEDITATGGKLAVR